MPAEVEEPARPTWASEPRTLEELLDQHVIETKVSGRHPGTSLFLAVATSRNGALVDALPDQKYKLFLAHGINIVTCSLPSQRKTPPQDYNGSWSPKLITI